jgi:hypothetical protein
MRIVGERTPGELGDAGCPVGDSFDEPQRGCGGTERRRQEARQQ